MTVNLELNEQELEQLIETFFAVYAPRILQ